MRLLLTVLAAAIVLTGCVATAPTASSTASRSASAAQKRGDWAAAAQWWEQAIQQQSDQDGFWQPEFSRSPKMLAAYYYELGRSLGVLGRYDEAEKNLLQALRLDEKFNGPIGMDLVELARLNKARGNNARAASYFDQVLPRMDEVSDQDPAAYIALLQEAATVYESLGKIGRAAELRAKVGKFSARHPNAKFPDGYGWTPYERTAK